MEILRTIHLKKYYGEGETCVKALDDVNFSVEKGEFVSIVVTSGSGKGFGGFVICCCWADWIAPPLGKWSWTAKISFP